MPAKGDGITKRADGRYMARYTVQTPDGPKRKTIYGAKYKDVEKKLNEARGDAARGLVFDDGDLTLGKYLDRWLLDSVRGTVRTTTLERYAELVRLHIKPVVGRVKLKNLSPAHVQGLYRDRLDTGLSPATVHKIHIVLHKALKQAVRWNMVPRNVTEAVTPPRPTPDEIRPLDTSQVAALLSGASGDRLEALYVLAVTTGARQGELLALKWEDLDLERKTLRIRRTLTRSKGTMTLGEPKTKKSRRTVPLTARAVTALKIHRKLQLEERMRLADLYKDRGLVFANEVGNITNPSNLRQRSFTKLLKLAGLPDTTRFHDLRHTCATLLLSRGQHPKLVQELLGHANIAITLDTYSHVLPGMGDGLADAMEDAIGGV